MPTHYRYEANPAPLGLAGFGMTTILLNLHNAGYYMLGSPIIAMGIFYGGLAQLIAGIMEFQRDNTFATTAFTSYGLFWLSFAFIVLKPDIEYEPELLGWYLAIWGVFTGAMFSATLRKNRALQVVFSTLTLLFFFLAIGQWAGSNTVTEIGGWVGIICGSSAFYLAAAEVINETYGRVFLPIGDVKKLKAEPGEFDIENIPAVAPRDGMLADLGNSSE